MPKTTKARTVKVHHKNANSIRIIAGDHRGRRLSFPDVEGLRPTPDRVRETVFNWLAPTLRGARCLDLFAGSGALGLEASSRGAAHVDMVEKDRKAAAGLRDNIALLKCSATALHQDAMAYLQSTTATFDVIFLDPPFRKGWLEKVLPLIAPLMAKNGVVYIERERRGEPLGPEWHTLREKHAGDVLYSLVERAG